VTTPRSSKLPARSAAPSASIRRQVPEGIGERGPSSSSDSGSGQRRTFCGTFHIATSMLPPSLRSCARGGPGVACIGRWWPRVWCRRGGGFGSSTRCCGMTAAYSSACGRQAFLDRTIVVGQTLLVSGRCASITAGRWRARVRGPGRPDSEVDPLAGARYCGLSGTEGLSHKIIRASSSGILTPHRAVGRRAARASGTRLASVPARRAPRGDRPATRRAELGGAGLRRRGAGCS